MQSVRPANSEEPALYNCVFFNPRHKSAAFEQFNDLMKLMKSKIRADVDETEGIALN